MTKADVTVELIYSTKALQNRLIELSRTGGAWIGLVKPFSNEVTFKRFQSPSRVPDSYYGLTGPHHLMGFRGQMVGFSQAALIREQNRRVSGD